MRLVHKTLHGLIIAKMRINFLIICGVIFVVGGGLIDRRRVNSGNAQLFQIIKFIRHALQVSAVKVIVPDIALIFPCLCILGIYGGVSIAEPLWENLVPDRLIDPLRHFVDINGIHPRHRKTLSAAPLDLHLFLTDKTVLKIIPALCLCHQFKIVF